MSFAVTMIWMIGTAIVVLLLIGIGFTAMAGALHMPGWLRRDHSSAGAGQDRLHVRHGH